MVPYAHFFGLGSVSISIQYLYFSGFFFCFDLFRLGNKNSFNQIICDIQISLWIIRFEKIYPANYLVL